MAVSSDFQDEIDVVDATWTLVYEVDATYDTYEWSFSETAAKTYTIKAANDNAHQMGASVLLEEEGFYYYGPADSHTLFIKRPASITGSKTSNGWRVAGDKQTYYIPNIEYWLAYGHSFSSITSGGSAVAGDAALGASLSAAYSKWATLNGVDIDDYPGGHRWSNIIGNHDEAGGFLENHPTMVQNWDTGDRRFFDLHLATLNPSEYALMVRLCAADMLNNGLNSFNRTNFDPSDGDTHTSDQVFQFGLDVVTEMRAGTPAISTLGSQVGVSDAQVGIYAYAGHRLPPSFDLGDKIYTSVARGFSSAGLGYPELVRQHGALADAIAVREYFDVMHWSWSRPYVGRNQPGYFDDYPGFVADGVIAVSGEFNANWLTNMVSTHYAIRLFKKGASSISTVISEVVTNIFAGDSAATTLLTDWMANTTTFNKFTLRRSCELIDALAASTLTTRLKELMVVLKNYLDLPAQTDPTYSEKFITMFTHIAGMKTYDTTHCYAWMRRLANGAVSGSFPELWMYRDTTPEYNTAPGWYLLGTAPTSAEFDAAFVELQADTVRDDSLFSSDLVVVDVTPSVAATAVGDCFHIAESVVTFVYFGPGNVTTVNRDGTELVTRFYAAGQHNIILESGKGGTGKTRYIYWDAGICFMDIFYGKRFQGLSDANTVPGIPNATNDTNYWFYFPQSAIGERLDMSGNLRIISPAGTTNINTDDITVIPRGQHRLHWGGSGGTLQFHGNIVPYVSPDPTKVLMPRAMAQKEFGGGFEVSVPTI
jgi:hypothetical protein